MTKDDEEDVEALKRMTQDQLFAAIEGIEWWEVYNTAVNKRGGWPQPVRRRTKSHSGGRKKKSNQQDAQGSEAGQQSL